MTMLSTNPLPTLELLGLLNVALPALDYAFRHQADPFGDAPWTIGGPAALAIRIGHRGLQRLDIHAPGARLTHLLPRHNPHAASISHDIRFTGHEIVFVRGADTIAVTNQSLQTTPGWTCQTFRSRPVKLETVEESIAKLVRYRADEFTFEDAFDLVSAHAKHPDVFELLAFETPDRLEALSMRLLRILSETEETRPDGRGAFAKLAATAKTAALSLVRQADIKAALRDAVLPANATDLDDLAWSDVPLGEIARRRGLIRLDPDYAQAALDAEIARRIREDEEPATTPVSGPVYSFPTIVIETPDARRKREFASAQRIAAADRSSRRAKAFETIEGEIVGEAAAKRTADGVVELHLSIRCYERDIPVWLKLPADVDHSLALAVLTPGAQIVAEGHWKPAPRERGDEGRAGFEFVASFATVDGADLVPPDPPDLTLQISADNAS